MMSRAFSRFLISSGEYQDEANAEMDKAEAGSGLGGMALSGPADENKMVYLVIYVWECEDLPRTLRRRLLDVSETQTRTWETLADIYLPNRRQA